MTIKRVQGKYERTPEQKAEDRRIRELVRDWYPSAEELIASEEGANFDVRGEFRGLRPFLAELKQAREAQGLTLAEVSARCGIDPPALSRLENGHYPNPTLDTLWRYAAAVGRQLVLATAKVPDTRPAPRTPQQRRPPGKKGKKGRPQAVNAR